MQPAKLIAKVALFNDKSEVLILRRSQTDKVRPGDLDLAGGSVDGDESPTEAVLREVKEEVGLELTSKDVALVYSATDYFEDVSRLRFLYIGRVKGNPKISLSFEHDKYEWMPLEKVFESYDHPVWVGGLRYLVDHNLLEV